jgi:eukaryotic translation initiation factor 2C
VLQEYFQNVYRRPIRYPRIFGVDFGTPDKPNIIPAELCSIPPGQIYKKKLSEQMMDKARSFATKKPQERIGIIKNGVSRGSQNILPPVSKIICSNWNNDFKAKIQTLEYRDSDFLKNAGMSVSPAPVTIQGRVLQAPGIRFASGAPVVRPHHPFCVSFLK